MSLRPDPNLNVPLLLKIRAKALRYPETFNMRQWGEKVSKTPEHPCGAIGCFAGHGILMHNQKVFNVLLDIENAKTYYQQEKIFENLSPELKEFFESASYNVDWTFAGAKALGIEEYKAHNLFLPLPLPRKGVSSARYVIQVIEKLLTENGIPIPKVRVKTVKVPKSHKKLSS